MGDTLREINGSQSKIPEIGALLFAAAYKMPEQKAAGADKQPDKQAENAEGFLASLEERRAQREDMASKLSQRDRFISSRFEGQMVPNSADCYELIAEYNKARDARQKPSERVLDQMKQYKILDIQQSIYDLAQKSPECKEIERITNERNKLAHSQLFENMRPFVTGQLCLIDAAGSDAQRKKLTGELTGSNPLGLGSLMRERDKPVIQEIVFLQLQINRKIAGRSR